MRLLPCALLPLVSPYVSSYVIAKHDRVPLLEEGGQGSAPGIGIHMTTSYATAAIRYANGTVENIARIEARADYLELVERWSHLKTPKRCTNKLEELMSFQCYLSHKLRQLSKRFGRPATRDIATLASLFRDVKNAVESQLGTPIGEVYPVFPYLEGLDADDIKDALEYSGLKWLPQTFKEQAYWSTNAAYAGMGYGLCNSWNDMSKCQEEENLQQRERVLFFNFDNSSFEATSHTMRSAYQPWPNSYAVKLELGWWSLPVYEVPRAKFWAKIQEVIVDVLSYAPRAPNKIVLLGDHGQDREFQETVKAAIWELLEFDASMVLEANVGTDATMLAARGAAELAFRMQHWNDPKRMEVEDGSMLEEIVEL